MIDPFTTNEAKLRRAAEQRAAAFREALAQAPTEQEQPTQPQEPDWLDKEQTETDWDHVWLLIKAASYASSRGFISGTSNWGSAVSRYMRNESPQPAQQQEPAGYFRLREYGEALIHDQVSEDAKHNEGVFPLYTSPQPAQPSQSRSDVKPLTDEQIRKWSSYHDIPGTIEDVWQAFDDAIKLANGIKRDAWLRIL